MPRERCLHQTQSYVVSASASVGSTWLTGALVCTSHTYSSFQFDIPDLVDDGNYTQTRVIHNTVITQGPRGYIKTGIGQGSSVWWTPNPPDTKFNCGAIVANNLIDSQDVGLGQGSIGYGLVLRLRFELGISAIIVRSASPLQATSKIGFASET